MLRKSIGGRLLAIVLAGAMTLNCSSVTAFAKGTQSDAVQMQEEELAQEDSSEQEEETSVEGSEASGESSEQTDAQAEKDDELPEESSEGGSEETAAEAVSEASETDSDTAESDSGEAASDQNTSEAPADADTASEASTEGKTQTTVVPEVREQKEYTYEDDDIYVVAILDSAEAVPDDAQLKVTAVNASSQDYNYDAYMDALNANSEEKEYTSENTLFYDVAFLYEEKDAEGNGTGRIIEYQPDFGAVNISFTFKQNQLNDQIETGSAADQDLEILHLPLTDSVRESVDTTADATEITENDIRVESVQNEQIDVDGGNVEFKVTGLSVIVLAAPLKAPARGPINGEIRLYAQDGTSPAQGGPGSAMDTAFPAWKQYGVLVYLTDKENGSVVGWQTVGIPAPNNSTTPFNFPSEGFYTYKDDGKTKDEADKVTYDPEKHNLVFRLYSKGWGGENYYNVINGQEGYSDTFEGFRFIGTTEEDGRYIISLKESEEMTYNVKVKYDPEDAIDSGDNYYVLVEVKHATTETTYVYEKITQTAADDLYQNIGTDAYPWKTASGTKVEKFTGNEKCTAYLIWSEDSNLSIADAIANTNCIKYDMQAVQEKETSEDGTSMTVTQVVDFSAFEKPTNDYSYESVMGPGVNYGLTANRYKQSDHAQTNFAANYYENAANSNFQPDLTNNPGDFVIAHLEGSNKIHLGNAGRRADGTYGGSVILYVGTINGEPVTTDNFQDDSGEGVLVVSDPDELTNNVVNPIIEHGKSMSSELGGHKSNYYAPTPAPGANSIVIDTTAYPSDATIYIEADSILNFLKASNGVRINKHDDQVIVFNIRTSDPVELKKFSYTYHGEWKESESPVSASDPRNEANDFITRHLVWNVMNSTDVTIGVTTGMFLVPAEGSTMKVDGTSSGNVITSGTFTHTSGEFHGVSQSMKNNDAGSLRAQKTVDGLTPTAAQKFKFTFEHYVDGEWVKLTRADGEETLDYYENNGSAIVVDINQLNDGFSVYRITESEASDEYTKDSTVYYAVIEYAAYTTTGGNVVRIAKAAKYYKNFDPSSYDPATNAAVSGQVSKAIFKNTTKTDEDGHLKVIKTVSGATLSEAKTFKFTVQDQDGNYYYLDGNETKSAAAEQFVELTVEAGQSSGESGTLTLPQGMYTVKESSDGTDITGYTLEVTGAEQTVEITSDHTEEAPLEVSVVNNYTLKTTQISAKKAWSPEDPEGASVEFTLYKNGEPTDQTVILDGTEDDNGESTPWTAMFSDLPEYDGERKIVYTVRETTGYPGYIVSTTEGVADGETITNTATEIKVSKKDIADSEELPGAVIQILKGEEVVEEWTSGTEPHVIRGLEVGTEYILREITAPDGYTLAEETTFTIGQDGTIETTGSVDGDTLLINDVKTKVKISKVDITSQEEIAGATLQILDAEGNVVVLDGTELSWVSSEEGPHIIEGLKTGVTYTLHEETAPAGYTVAANTTFTIGTDGTVSSGATQTEDNVLLVEDALTEVKVSKIDIADGEEVAGAVITILDAEGTMVDSWTSAVDDESTEDVNEAVHVIRGLSTGVTYTLHEETAPEGYTVAADTTFTIDKEGNVTSEGTQISDGVILVADQKTVIKVSKVDVAGGEELEGAHIQIIDKEGSIVEEWDSTDQAHEVEGLKTGEEYTLRETVAPVGYTVTTDTTFTINEDGSVTSSGSVSDDGVLLVEDTLTSVKISKVDVADSRELEGAHIQIIETDEEGNETIVTEWDSTDQAHEVTGLKTEVEYTLRETVAPEGYTVTTDVTFSIDKNGNVTSSAAISDDGVILIEDGKTSVKVSKVDVADGKEVAGAHIQIIETDEEGHETIAAEWDSTTKAHEVEGLKAGVTYTLRETVAPEGYTITADTTFTIDENGNVSSTDTTIKNGVLLVEDEKTSVKVSKVDIADGEEVEGATIQILENGEVVEEWTSGAEAHEVKGLKTGVTYTLHETVAPDGYLVTTDTTFTIDENGNVTSTGSVSDDGVLLVEDAKTSVKVSKVDIANGEELAGAHIQIIEKDEDGAETVVEEWDSTEQAHIAEGLKTGVTYTLRETVAPEGYAVTADTTFTIDENGDVTSTDTKIQDGVLLVEDALTKISVSKTDIADGKELEGAHIQILDSEGNIVEEWDSTKKAHEIEGLKTETEYTLRETVAPEGYTVTTDITFTIDKTGKVTSSGPVTEDGTLLINDSKTRISVSKVDIADGEELEGAQIQIVEMDEEGNEKIVESWTSGKEAHEIEGLKTGVEYILRETVAPEGYTVAAETTFTINENGEVESTATITSDGVILVEDAKTRISVSKTDVADGKELEGAHIQIIEKGLLSEKVITEWDSTTEPHVVEGLKTGVEYILRETVAPDGYTVTTDTKFTIDEKGNVTSTGTVSDDGVLLVEDEMTTISVSKVDIADGKELEGATIQILEKGEVVEEWVSGKEPHEIKGLKTGVEYTLKETVAPEGYAVTTNITFSIDESGKVTSTGTVTEDGVLLVEDGKTKVSVSKVDIADGKELEGAHIQILDSEGNIVEEWDSTKEAHEISGLKTGEEYTLKETVAPDGYTVTTDTKFSIDETGKVTSTGTISEDGVLLVEDTKTKVSVSKTDVADGEELEGAHIQIILKEGIFGKETIIEEWDSTKEAHVVEGLKTGVEYILRETVAPDGYTVTTDTKFSIDETGKVTSTGTISEDGVLLVEDTKTKVSVSKVDIADGEELEGAHIQILDSEGNVVEEWDSTKEAHEIEGLKTGEEYTLHETVAPEGYTVTTDTTFTIDEKGKVTSTGSTTTDEEGNTVLLVEDAKTKVSVSKTDIADGKELEGAHIQILDSEGNVVEEWDSTKEAHEIEGLKTGVTYTLKETVAPDGYTVTSETTFTIDEKGKVTSTGSQTEDGTLLINDAKTRISVSKVDIADGEEIAGATIQIVDAEGNVVEEWVSTEEAHVIEGLKTGVEYTLKETAAPDGYTVAAETTFTIDEKGKVTTTASVSSDGTLLVEDAKTKISVSKVDIADGEELEGAHIQIIDSEGNVVEEWDSTKEAHEIEGLKTGEEYTLRETVAPDGYTVTTDTTFTIDEKGNVTSTGSVTEDGVLLVEDAKTRISVSKVDIADGEELEGAHIQIIDKDGNVVEEWDSTKEAHEIEGLKTGEEYTLRETVAPDGYTVTTDTKFSIDETGKVTSTGSITADGVLLVEDAKTVVKVSKVDVADGKELEGAHIQIIVKEGLFGKERVVEEWDSGKEAHEVIGLKTGVQYILRETVAPEGYAVTTDTTFTIDENGKVTSTGSVSEDGVMLVEDAMTVVKVSKVDIANGKELEGAKIQLLLNGEVIEEWVSGKEPHVIIGLKTEVEYTLRETVAPEGYELTTDTTFIIDKYGKVTATGSKVKDGVILIEDALKSKKPGKKTKDSSRTSDDANAMLWLMLALGASGSLVYVARRRRNAR